MIAREGLAEIEVENADRPEDRRKTGFFNPAMRENRDIAVLALKWFSRHYKKGKALDAFSATGIRAIRFEKEAGWDVVATEVNETAFKRLEANLEMNGSRAVAKLKDCRLEMMESKFQAIDIDPYGSPSQFVEFSAFGLDKTSMLMVTATDTANLFGVYPKKCEKVYCMVPERQESPKEIGTRILVGHVIRVLGKHDKAFMPLISYSHRHYVRTIGLVRRSSPEVYKLLSEFREWKERKLFLGKIKDIEFARETYETARKMETMADSTVSLLSAIKDELDVPFYYDSHRLKLQLSMDDIRKKIESAGHMFSRTHFSPTAFKTDMGRDEMKKLFKI